MPPALLSLAPALPASHSQHAIPTQSRSLCPRISALPLLHHVAFPREVLNQGARRRERLAVSAEALTNRGKQFSASDAQVKRILGEGSYGAAYEVSHLAQCI